MKLKIFIITLLFLAPWLIKAQSLSEKLVGVWQINGDVNKLCMVFINSHSGAVTAEDGLLYYYFTYDLTDGEQPVLITEHIPIYNEKQYPYRRLIQLQNDSTLLLNEKLKDKGTLDIKEKYVLTYRKIKNINTENFIRKPAQADLIGTWLNVFKKDTTIFNFQTNNVLEIKNLKTSNQSSGMYIVDFDKQPMALDIINQKGDISPHIFVFIGNSELKLAGPKNGKRRNQFTIFGGNVSLKKKKSL